MNALAHRFRLLSLSAGLLFTATPILAQSRFEADVLVESPRLIVVGPTLGPGVDYTQIDPALDAAEQGEVIRVLGSASFYAPFTAVGKGVSIIFDEAAQTFGTSVVRNLGAERSFQLVGFCGDGLRLQNIQGQVLAQGGRIGELDVLGCSGPVWLEEAELRVEVFGTQTNAAAHITNSAHVLFRDCLVRGAPSTLGNPSEGLLADASTVFAWNTTFIGTGAGIFGGGGRDGARLRNGAFLYADSSTFQGGGGFSFDCGTLEEGGHGVLAIDSEAALRNAILVPGHGHDPCGEPPGPPADETATSGTGTITLVDSPARTFEVVNPIRIDEDLQVSVNGVPHGFAFVLASTHLEPNYLPSFISASILEAPLTNMATIALDENGVGNASLSVALPPEVFVDVVWLQAVFLDASNVMGPANGIVVLDSRF